MIQLELPLFGVRSTADDPVPEQERTHPAQMVIQHCGKAKVHVSHAYEDAGWCGCPGVPDIRDDRHHCRETKRAHASHGWSDDRAHWCGGSPRPIEDVELP